MSDLLQIFTGNPLSTFIGKKIEAATRPELESEDWALNMEICDIINENDDDAKDAARAIKKRLQQIEQDRDFTITNRTLTVLDTCVSNCSHRFHILVMTKDFIQDLVKLIGPKNNPPIDLQERVLSMIERWSEAFRGQPDLGGVVSVYNDLKAKGVTFPPRDPNSSVPIRTPQRTVSGSSPPLQRSGRQTSQSADQRITTGPSAMAEAQVLLEGEGYNKISQDLVIVQSSIEMFEDVMRALQSPNAGDAEWKLASELSITCHQMKDRIIDLIERIANEDLTIELLSLNDELINVFSRYEELEKRRSGQAASESRVKQQGGDPADSKKIPVQVPQDQSGQTNVHKEAASPSSSQTTARLKLAGVSSSTLNELAQIDFNATRTADRATSQKSDLTTAAITSPAPTVSAKASSLDPFDTSNILKETSKKYTITERLGGLSLSDSDPSKSSRLPSGLPEEVATVREQDFAEIENWLSTDSGRDLSSISGDMPSLGPISVPNSEFENFIASRALAGSNAGDQKQEAKSQERAEPSK